MEPVEIDTRTTLHKPRRQFPWLWASIAGVVVIVVVLLFSIAISNLAPSEKSPSQTTAKRNEKVLEDFGSTYFGATARSRVMNHKGDIDFSILESDRPTIMMGKGTVFGKQTFTNYIRVHMKLENRSAEVISSIKGKVQFKGKERTIPYCSESYLSEIAGGVEPNEIIPVTIDVPFPDFRGSELTKKQLDDSQWFVFLESVNGSVESYSTTQGAVVLTKIEPPNPNQARDFHDVLKGAFKNRRD